MKKNSAIIILLVTTFLCGGLTGCLEEEENENGDHGDFHTIMDMAGREVLVPRNITRVIDISDGFITSVMDNLNITEKIIALGSRNLEYIDRYDFITTGGENYSYENGMNPYDRTKK